MSELVIRPLTAGEEQLFESLCDPGLAGPAAFNHTYADGAAKGHYRPEWTWVALLDGVVLARAAWWGGPDDDQPVVLDWFDFTHADAATRLLRESGHRTGYRLRLPADWRERPEARAAGRARIDAATAAGLTLLVERYRYCWTPDCGLPERPGRLEFRPEPDDVVILDVFRRIHWGTLDAHTRRVMAESGIDAAAKEDLDFLLWFPSPRGWWRLAYTPDGDLVGLSVPALNYSGPVIGFIGVLPEHRGHGYAYDLLVEATHVLVANGANQVVAATDVPNTPMAATFAKVGYPITERMVDLVPKPAA